MLINPPIIKLYRISDRQFVEVYSTEITDLNCLHKDHVYVFEAKLHGSFDVYIWVTEDSKMVGRIIDEQISYDPYYEMVESDKVNNRIIQYMDIDDFIEGSDKSNPLDNKFKAFFIAFGIVFVFALAYTTYFLIRHLT